MFKTENKPGSSEACRVALMAVQDALYVLHGKWKLPIIVALSEGKKRFGEIQKAVKGIAPKVLSSELKTLELNGFVVRHVHNEFPVLVEYELTEYSDTLENVIKSLSDWGQQHRARIREEIRNGNGNGHANGNGHGI